jgi:cob(I)alamin adenosyltransferase
MKIYTKKGDSGETSLIGGTRVPKHHLRIEAYGTVDELNSYLGWLGEQKEVAAHKELLKLIQDKLFVIGSHLANDDSKMKLPEIHEEDIAEMEMSIDKMELDLPPLKNFVLPGGHAVNAMAHIARCVCRRAERNVVHLMENTTVEPLILHFLNRLSDWLFVLSRYVTYSTNSEEIAWNPR